MKTNSRGQILCHVILILMLLCTFYPILFAVSNSFKTMQDAFNSILSLIPPHPTLENYRYVFQKLPFGRITANSFLIAVSVTFAKLFTSLLAAYAFVYFRFRGKNTIYLFMLTTMFIPFTVTMIPNYLLISKIGLRDNIWGVAFPQLADVLGIFLLRQAMRGIPASLIEAAKLDNIRDFKIMTDIVLPLVKPAIISTGIIFYINSWNEYVWPVLILKSTENYTLPLALQMFVSSEGGTDFTTAMAVSILTILIPLVLYLIFQRQIISTFATSGVKG